MQLVLESATAMNFPKFSLIAKSAQVPKHVVLDINDYIVFCQLTVLSVFSYSSSYEKFSFCGVITNWIKLHQIKTVPHNKKKMF